MSGRVNTLHENERAALRGAHASQGLVQIVSESVETAAGAKITAEITAEITSEITAEITAETAAGGFSPDNVWRANPRTQPPAPRRAVPRGWGTDMRGDARGLARGVETRLGMMASLVEGGTLLKMEEHRLLPPPSR